MMFLNVLLHQSFTTTSSNKNAMTGSLETAVSSIHTSVMSVKVLVKKMQSRDNRGHYKIIEQLQNMGSGEDKLTEFLSDDNTNMNIKSYIIPFLTN